MRVSQNLVGVPGDECICGRRQTVAHCPSCGSTRRYARANRMHRLVDGTDKFVKVQLRCMSCGHEYIDAEREFCEAPPVGAILAAQKARALYEAKQSGEYLSDKELKMLKAVETLTGVSATQLSPEQREELEAKLDMMIRSAWADAMFAHRDKSGPDPGPCEEFVAAQKKKFFITNDGRIQEVPQASQA
jgi:hypothetical protein